MTFHKLSETLKIIPYSQELHYLSLSFSCGNYTIDNFFKHGESLESDICKTYLFVETNNEEIVKLIGFFSIVADCVHSKENNSNNQVIFSGGAIRILMFAIDKRYQKTGVLINNSTKTYASIMLMLCFEQIYQLTSNYIGATFIVLDATNEGQGLYKNIGDFIPLSEDDEFGLSFIPGDGDCIPMYKYVKDEWY